MNTVIVSTRISLHILLPPFSLSLSFARASKIYLACRFRPRHHEDAYIVIRYIYPAHPIITCNTLCSTTRRLIAWRVKTARICRIAGVRITAVSLLYFSEKYNIADARQRIGSAREEAFHVSRAPFYFRDCPDTVWRREFEREQRTEGEETAAFSSPARRNRFIAPQACRFRRVRTNKRARLVTEQKLWVSEKRCYMQIRNFTLR